jgi:hypothetical protein
VGAFCNVLSGALGTGIMPAFPGSEWFFFVKNYVGDLILWLAVLVMVMMALAVLRERRLRGRRRHTDPRRRPLDDPHICVVLTAYDDEQPIAGATRDFRSHHVETVIVADNNFDGTGPGPGRGQQWLASRRATATPTQPAGSPEEGRV